MFQPKTDLQGLKDYPIRELAEALGIELRGYRSNGRCFNFSFHSNGDSKPSLGFDDDYNRFKCFACGISGDTLDLVQQVKGCDFKEAISFLEALTGNLVTTGSKIAYPKANRPTLGAPTPKDIELYQKFYDLCIPLIPEHLKFLQDKGFSDYTIRKFGWKTITDLAIKQFQSLYPEEDLINSGLFRRQDSGFLSCIFWYHRLLVPYFENGQLKYLRARVTDSTSPKYISLLNKSAQLFNLDSLLDLTPDKPLLLCESETDAMAAYQLGHIAVAIPGVTQTQAVESLKSLILQGLNLAQKGPNMPEPVKLSELKVNHYLDRMWSFYGSAQVSIILAFDSDAAGQQGIKKVGEVFFSNGIKLKTLHLPTPLKDLNEYLVYKNSKYPKQSDITDLKNQLKDLHLQIDKRGVESIDGIAVMDSPQAINLVYQLDQLGISPEESTSILIQGKHHKCCQPDSWAKGVADQHLTDLKEWGYLHG